MQSDNRLAEVEPQSQSSLTIRFPLPGRIEQIKQVTLCVIRNAGAIIRDPYFHGIPF